MSNLPDPDATISRPDPALLVRALRQQESCWANGRRVLTEELLNEHPELRAAPSAVLELVYNEAILAEEQGAAVELSDLQRRFPELAAELRIQWEVDQALASRRTLRSGPAAGRAAAGPLARVGRYEVRAVLGKGGMGIVYRAWDPHLKRDVALKMNKGDEITPDEQARFRTEAAAIAQVRHAHIVQVYDVGEFEGRPYFTMEFCAGGSLADRLKKRPLPEREAAAVVEQIAHGVAAAHERRIIHRDLKPGNVLLTAEPDAPAASSGLSTDRGDQTATHLRPSSAEADAPLYKVTDFGLAKDLASDDGRTRTGAILGTPSYMAPEQAFGTAKELQPSADVYSMGAILYECLTGRPPFQGATAAETIAQLRTQDPVPVRRLQPSVSRDLETVCLKCLAKEPRSRYASARDLADDLRRFLHGEPIHARATPAYERAWKWAKARPLAAAALTVAAVAVVGLLAVWARFTTALQDETTKAKNSEQAALKSEEVATAQRVKAEANRDAALDAIDRLLTRVGDNKLKDVPGLEELRRDVLVDAQAVFAKLLEGESDPDPQVRREAGRALWRSAKVHSILGHADRQGADLEKAEALQRQLLAEFPDQPSYQSDLARTLHSRGLWVQVNGKPADRRAAGLRLLEEAFDLRRRVAEGGSPDARADWARTMIVLGNTYKGNGDRPRGEKTLRDSLPILTDLCRTRSNPLDHRDLLTVHLNLSALYLQDARLAEAEAILKAGVELGRQFCTKFPTDADILSGLAGLYQNQVALAYAAKRDGGDPVASKNYLELREKTAAQFRAVPYYRYALAIAYRDTSTGWAVGRTPEEYLPAHLDLGRKAVAILRELHREFPGTTAYQVDLARSCSFVGMALADLGQYDEGIQRCSEAVTLIEELVKARPEDTRTVLYQGNTLVCLAIAYDSANRPAEAKDWARRGRSLLEPILKKTNDVEAKDFFERATRILAKK